MSVRAGGLAARLLREPLLHFLVLGAALFGLFAGVGREGDPAERRIVVTAGTVRHLSALFERTWRRPPTPAELEGLVADHVREEILYREALALGLDRDDVIVRRRMRQKLELMAEGLGRSREPGDEELAAFAAARPERYAIEPRVTFRHVYVSRDRHGDEADTVAERWLAELGAGADPAGLGDPLPLPATFTDVSLSEAGRQLGDAFAARLGELPLGVWAGPVRSGLGLHLVRVEARSEARVPAIEEIRDAVVRDWRAAQAEAASAEMLRALRARYEVVIEAPGGALAEGDAPDRAQAAP